MSEGGKRFCLFHSKGGKRQNRTTKTCNLEWGKTRAQYTMMDPNMRNALQHDMAAEDAEQCNPTNPSIRIRKKKQTKNSKTTTGERSWQSLENARIQYARCKTQGGPMRPRDGLRKEKKRCEPQGETLPFYLGVMVGNIDTTVHNRHACLGMPQRFGMGIGVEFTINTICFGLLSHCFYIPMILS